MATHTRRDFITTSSLAAAGTLLQARGLGVRLLPAAVESSVVSASAVLPDPVPALQLQALATSAIDAARQAGASYADIRIADRSWLSIGGQYKAGILMEVQFTYGVRVLVDGAWAFDHGSVASADAVTTAARNAVAMARGYARFKTRSVELAPVPAATGEWATPIREDPFTVPLRDQRVLVGAYETAAMRVRRVEGVDVEIDWTRETRVFASSEGALVTQHLWRVDPQGRVRGVYGTYESSVNFRLQRLFAQSGGYETIADAKWQDQFKAVSEEAAQLASLPRRPLEVGRYPVVLDGATLGMVLGCTLGSALELDRVLGYEADASGTSYLSPPSQVIGTAIAGAGLTVTGHRQLPSVSAVKWDDEGVEAHAFPMITNGRLASYANSRQTASALTSPSSGHAQPVRGCAVAPEAGDPVLIRAPHLTVAPGTQAASVEELCADITRGILLLDSNQSFSTDQQLSSGSLNCDRNNHDGLMLEIKQGKLVSRVVGNGIQFRTAAFWHALTALGDASTVRETAFEVQKGMPWRPVLQSATAPAGHFKEVNVISTAVVI